MSEYTKIDKLSRSSDYRSWSIDVRSAMTTSQGLHKFLEKEPVKGNADELLLDEQARAKILLCLDRSMKNLVIGCKTAASMWKRIRDDYIVSTNERRQYVMSKLCQLRQGNSEYVQSYCDRGLAMALDLVDLDYDNSIVNEMIIPAFIRGVNPRYASCVPHLNSVAASGFTVVSATFRAVAMNMNVPQNSRSNAPDTAHINAVQANRKYRKPRKETRACYYCKEVGHIAVNCPKKKQQNENGPGASTSAHVNAVASTDHEEEAVIMVTQECKKSSKVCVPEMQGVHSNHEKLVFDSAASHHFVGDMGILHNVRPSSVKEVVLGAGEKHEVVWEGDMWVRAYDTGLRTMFQSVMYVPGLTWNLCSGVQITKRGSSYRGAGRFLNIYDKNGCLRLKGQRGESLVFMSCVIERPAQCHITTSVDIWHQRFAHAGHQTLQRMSKNRMVSNMPKLDMQNDTECETCITSKQVHCSHPPSVTRAKRPLERVHSDVMMEPVSDVRSNKYVVTVSDDYSRYTSVSLIGSKDQVPAAVIGRIKQWERLSEQKVKYLRSDKGTEYKGMLTRFLHASGITHETSVPYTPQQNGRAERLNRTLQERTRAVLHHFNLPDCLWGYAIEFVTVCFNATVSVDGHKTPYELFFGEVPDVGRFRVFGCKAFVLKNRKDKLEQVSEKGIFIGYPSNSKGWLVLVERDDQFAVVESCDVRFIEHETFTDIAVKLAYSEYGSDWLPALTNYPIASATSSYISGNDVDLDGNGIAHDNSHVERHVAVDSEQTESDDTEDLLGMDSAEEVMSQPQVSADNSGGVDVMCKNSEERRYPIRERQPRVFPESYLCVVEGHMPQTISDAFNRDDGQLWREAYEREHAALMSNCVYNVVRRDEVPTGTRIVKSRIVCNIKHDDKGFIKEYKVRIVAKGYMQSSGIDLADICAPTVRTCTVHMLLAYAMSENLRIRQIDVKTAFLNGKLDEPVYVEPPKGHTCDTQEVWKLNRALYGLRQAAVAWNKTWTVAMIEIGFVVSECDPCLFYMDIENERLFVAIHVDDAILIGKRDALNLIVEMIEKKFAIKDEGFFMKDKVSVFLGVEMLIRSDGLFLSQKQYVRDVLSRFGMQDCRTKPSQLPRNCSIDNESAELPCGNDYASLIGALLYLSIHTRPDIAFAVSMLCRCVARPRVKHLENAKHILRYLAGTPNGGLLYPVNVSENRSRRFSDKMIDVFVDANFAGCKESAKSTTGMLIKYNDCAVSWMSKLQPIVAKSTCEAEYVAADIAVAECLWLRKMAADLFGKTMPIKLNIDNQAAITLTRRDASTVTGRIRHIDVRFHFVRDHVMKKEVIPMFVQTEKQLADQFTKALDSNKVRAMAIDSGMVF